MLKKAWNFKISEKARSAIKARAVRYLAWFLLLMGACTIVSRAADGMAISTVQAESPKRTNIGHNVSLAGQLVADGDIPVLSESGMLVQSIAVEKGDTVQEGDLLFTLDTSALEEQIADKKDAIARKKAEISAARKNSQLAAESENLALQRLYEDYALALQAADRDIAEAEQALRDSIGKRNSYGLFLGEEQEYDYAQEAALEADVQAKRKALEDAQVAREGVVRKYERALEDAALDEKADSSSTLQKMDLEALQKALAELEDTLARGGQVTAPQSGIITRVEIAVGKSTGSEAAMYLNSGENIRFQGEISKAQAKYAAPGDKMQITPAGGKDPFVVEVTSVEPLEDDPARYRVTAKLEPGKGLPGQLADAEISQRSKTYEACVPLSALFEDNGQHYVLCVRETETALGREYRAERVNVTLEDSNESTAALSGGLTPDTLIITSSSRVLRDGDRIRLEGSVQP